MQEGLKALEALLDPYDWFYEVCIEGLRYVVYVHTMDKEQDTIVPDRMMGRQVLIHFASCAPDVKNEFVSKPQTHALPTYSPFDRTPLELITDKDVELFKKTGGWFPIANEPNISALTDELDYLEKQCGSNILGEIFFEVHDKHNAVTNLSNKYPEIRKIMNDLYDRYGFNIIYDELEL
jgi:hypothetical protein